MCAKGKVGNCWENGHINKIKGVLDSYEDTILG